MIQVTVQKVILFLLILGRTNSLMQPSPFKNISEVISLESILKNSDIKFTALLEYKRLGELTAFERK